MSDRAEDDEARLRACNAWLTRQYEAMVAANWTRPPVPPKIKDALVEAWTDIFLAAWRAAQTRTGEPRPEPVEMGERVRPRRGSADRARGRSPRTLGRRR